MDQSVRINDAMSEKIIGATQSLVTDIGTEKITVRMVLNTLGISNRVFYNRFSNIEEVLDIIYENTVMNIRKTMMTGIDPEKDFFAQVTDMVTAALGMSYDKKMNFSYYVFENDSTSKENYLWWTERIKNLIEYAKENGHITDVDSDAVSYSIWCFCRGYNADAVCRGLPKEQAIESFRYSFGLLLNGMRKQ